jgi:Holliday junction resolvase RusA-like endonuclease
LIRFTIKGEPASKSNQRKLVTFGAAPPWRSLLERMVRQAASAGARAVVEGWIGSARQVLAMDDKSRPALIKSSKARNYEDAAVLQIPPEAKQMLTGPVRMTIRIFYASERPDLDESVVLDVLQAKYGPVVKDKPRELIRKGVYINDRQVRERHVYHGIDKANPRAEIEVEPLQPQPVALDLGLDLDVPKERPIKVVPLQQPGGREPDPF